MVRALTSHQCVACLIPGPGIIYAHVCGLSLLLVLFSAPRGLSLGTLVFPSPQNQHFQIPILAWKVSPINAKALDTFDNQIKVIIIIITDKTCFESVTECTV